jgi:hypothetical protein
MSDTMDIYQIYCNKLIKNGYDLKELNNYENFKNIFNESEFKEILNEKQRRKNKRYRTKNKYIEILKINSLIDNENKKIVFGTITLNDKSLKLKENTYIKKIHNWLKKHFIIAILNKDYGKKNEREHYHFIGLTIEDLESKNIKSKKGYEIFELKNKDYTMGFEPTLCLIDNNMNDSKQTINYLLKLNNHSSKEGTKSRIRVIKSSKCDYMYMLYRIKPTRAENRLRKENKKGVK